MRFAILGPWCAFWGGFPLSLFLSDTHTDNILIGNVFDYKKYKIKFKHKADR